MQTIIIDTYVDILKSELVPALGCTEPISIAYAAAKARDALGCSPERISVDCSGNIIKNVKGVVVPNSDGMKGIAAAAILGTIGGDASMELEVLKSVTPEHIEKTRELVSSDFCAVGFVDGVENLYVLAKAYAGDQNSLVEISAAHTNVTRIEKNGGVVFSKEDDEKAKKEPDKNMLNLKDIIEFADTVELSLVQDVLERQIRLNTEIANEGLLNDYGAGIGRTLIKHYDKSDVRVRARALAAAGSDARMGGCALPVVINSGSGNQGMAVSLPVIEYAKELGSSHEQLLRALCVSNLISLLQKRYIGNLSAFCGAVSAATGAASGITYLHGGRYDEISRTITNTLANVGGIVCDGAKSSCAAKIASSVDAGIMGFIMSVEEGRAFLSGDGIVKDNADETIESVGRVGRDGMRATDVEILKIMIGK